MDGKLSTQIGFFAGIGTMIMGWLIPIRFPDVPIVWQWVLLIIGALFIIFSFIAMIRPKLFSEKVALKIVFDKSNPNNRFWSQVPQLDQFHKPTGNLLWEHRIEIKNISTLTIKNVGIEIAFNGATPHMPRNISFIKDGALKKDIQPGMSEFCSFLYIGKPQAGDAYGKTAKALYSPIKVTASGDDIQSTSISFNFFPDEIPSVAEAFL